MYWMADSKSTKHLAEISLPCDVALVAEFEGKSLSFKHMIELNQFTFTTLERSK